MPVLRTVEKHLKTILQASNGIIQCQIFHGITVPLFGQESSILLGSFRFIGKFLLILLLQEEFNKFIIFVRKFLYHIN